MANKEGEVEINKFTAGYIGEHYIKKNNAEKKI